MACTVVKQTASQAQTHNVQLGIYFLKEHFHLFLLFTRYLRKIWKNKYAFKNNLLMPSAQVHADVWLLWHIGGQILSTVALEVFFYYAIFSRFVFSILKHLHFNSFQKVPFIHTFIKKINIYFSTAVLSSRIFVQILW